MFPLEQQKMDKNKSSQPLENSQPLAKTQRLTLPKKSLRLKRAAKEILHDLTIEFLSPKEIISRRKCSKQAVYKVIKKLKEKGLFDIGMNPVNLKRSTPSLSQPLAHQIRLHAQEWNIKIIQKSDKYFRAKQRANTVVIDGNTIRLYQDSIEIYSGQSFFEGDEDKAMSASIAYWRAFFARLEHEFDVILVKPRVQNINLVNQHFGETNSEMAFDAISRKQKYRITTDDDGKVWFSLDDSFNFKEMETQHPETSKPDMSKVRKQVNDWRKNDPPTNSELAASLAENVQCSIQNAQHLGQYAIHLQAHVQSVKDLGAGVNNFVKKIDELSELIKRLAEKLK